MTYRKEGDYYLPNLSAPEAPVIGKYGMLRRSYLRRHRNGLYAGMLLSGRLNAHLEEIDRQAGDMVDRITAQLAKSAGVTERLKTTDQLKWVGLMNNYKVSAEEAVLRDLICC